MEAIFGTFLAGLLPVVGTVASALATWGLAEATRWVRTKTKNEMVDAAMARVTHTTQTVVDEIAQTMVARGADGKIDKKDAAELKDVAIRRIQAQLPSAVQDAAKLGATSLVGLIAGKVEQAVAKNKAAMPLEGSISETATDKN